MELSPKVDFADTCSETIYYVKHLYKLALESDPDDTHSLFQVSYISFKSFSHSPRAVFPVFGSCWRI